MIINYEYDVFIAFFNSGERKSFTQANEIKEFLENKGLRCFLFKDSENGGNNINYKATFIQIMQSRFFLLVVNGDGLEKDAKKLEKDTKKLEKYKKILERCNNYHLNVEIDIFYALIQEGLRKLEDSAIVCYSAHPDDNYPMIKQLQENYTLFRDSSCVLSVFSNENLGEVRFEKIEKRIKQQITKQKLGESESNISNELVEIYSRYNSAKYKFAEIFRRYIINGNVKSIKCMGIKNTILSCDYVDLLQDAVKLGATIEIFVLSPNSYGAEIRAKERGRELSVINRESQSGISDIYSRLKEIVKDKEKIIFYLYENVPRQNMIVLETEGESFLFVHEYCAFDQGLMSPTLFIKKDRNNTNNSIYDYYIKIFNEMRKTAVKKSFDDCSVI